MFRVASRNNIDKNYFEIWGAVLDPNFTKFNNKIESAIFHSENDIYQWLDSGRGNNKNGDPNKIYSIYKFIHNTNDPQINDGVFLYSLRFKRPSETPTTYVSLNGEKRTSSFKKVEKKMCLDNIIKNYNIEYSSDIREIDGICYEGIYPLDINDGNNDIYFKKYLEYVTKINNMDISNTEADYSIVYINNEPSSVKWLENFINKLDYVEKYIEILARGENKYLVNHEPEHNVIINKIVKILDDNKKNTYDDMIMQNKIISTVVNPQLCTKDNYQIRMKDNLISWHRNYIHIIKQYGLIPSKQFVDIILNFNLMDLVKQVHTKENLLIMLKNIQEYYGIEHMRIKPIQPKNNFKKIIRSFNK